MLGLSFLIALALHAATHGEPGRAEPPKIDVESLRAALAALPSSLRERVPQGAIDSVSYNLDVAERIAGRFTPQAEAWRRRGKQLLDAITAGQDPALTMAGKIWMRGYRSEISEHLQGYAIYVPESYDPARAYPLLVMLHGGSANGNLFLGVVLGNNMNWKQYSEHLWDEYSPRWSPDFIVVAPDGFGHVMWRFMGERDVLDVIDDVQRHYSVDPDRIAFSGLSNGGVGAYNLGLRHAHRFSYVGAIAGAPSWLQYAGGAIPDAQRRAMEPQSGMQVAENAINTDFRYYHGHTDPGPMRPRFVQELSAHIKTLGVPFTEKWYDTGHDLLYLVHRHGKIYDELAPLRRKHRPSEVRVQSGDYRASTQHWVTITRIEDYPSIARVAAKVQGDTISVTTRGVKAFSLDLRDVPLAGGEKLTVLVDMHEAYVGPRAVLGHVAHFVRGEEGFQAGFPKLTHGTLHKQKGQSGPITDAYFDAMAHVYGTQDPEATEALKKSAEKGAQGWPLWLWRVQQKVLADTEVTDEILASHHLVLYATPGSHALLDRIADKLPVRIDKDAVVLGERRFTQRGVGVRFIYPSPLAPHRYVIVQGSPTPQGVAAGHQLPDFLPDYVVYDAASTASRPRLAFSKSRTPPAMGYFDDHWQLRPESELTEAPKKEEPVFLLPTVPPPPPPTPPPTPAIPTEFRAPANTQAGRAARDIATRVSKFPTYRTRIPRAVWRVDPLAKWSIRANDACLRELKERGVRARVHEAPLLTPVPTPVEVHSIEGGLALRMSHPDRPLLMSCELAARLPALSQLLRELGVKGIDVMSAYREQPFPSFHTLGLALDLWRFVTKEGALIVREDFEQTPDHATCEVTHEQPVPARKLREIACRLAESGLFSSVLTPNYNAGHYDHFHVDIRPDDPRLYVR